MQAFRQWVKGILLRDNNDTGIGDLSGTLTSDDNGAVYIYQQKIKAFLSGSEVEVTTNSQTQTLTNKTIDADNNTISNLEVDNLKSGVLDIDLTSVSASDDTLASAKAIKTYVDDQIATVNEASEISYSNTTSGLTATDVQAAIDEVEGRVDTVEGGLPSGAIVGTTDAQTLTNKTIDADSNTISNIDNNDIKAAAGIEMSKLEALTVSRATETDGSGEIVASSVTSAELGHLSGVTSAIQTQINGKQASDADLTALAALSGTGMLSRTGAATYAERTIAGTTDEIDVSNGDGVSGAPTIGISDDPVLPGSGSATMPSGNTAARPGSATNGMFRYNSETDKFEGYQAGAWGEVGGGSGTGNVNLLSTDSFDDGITGVTKYRNTVNSDSPDDFGGTAPSNTDLELIHNTSTQLRGLGSLRASKKTAVDLQGSGFYIETETLSDADVGRVLTLNYLLRSSANYSDGLIRQYVVTSTDSFVADFQVQELPQRDIPASDLLQYLSQIQINTDKSGTVARVCWHYTSDSSIYDIDIDGDPECSFGPIKAHIGLNAKSTEAWTPTGSLTTNVSYSGYTYEISDRKFCVAYVSFTGTNTEGVFTLDLPDGMTFDSDKNFTVDNQSVLGTATMKDSSGGSTGQIDGIVRYNSSNKIEVNILDDSSGSNHYLQQVDTSAGNPFTIASGDSIVLEFSFAPTQLSSTVTSSVLFPNRDIKGEAERVVNQSVTSALTTVINLNSLVEDTIGAWDTSTNFEYVVQEKGEYEADGIVQFAANASGSRSLGFRVIKPSGTTDITPTQIGANPAGGASTIINGSYSFNLDAGDTIRLICFQASGGLLNVEVARMRVNKKSTPQTMLGSESVNMKAKGNGGTVLTAAVTNIDFDTVIYDTHNAWDGDSYTIPVSGKYALNGLAKFTGAFNDYVGVYINGSVDSYMNVGVGSSTNPFHGEIDVNKGDVVTVRTVSGAYTLNDIPDQHWLAIHKIG